MTGEAMARRLQLQEHSHSQHPSVLPLEHSMMAHPKDGLGSLKGGHSNGFLLLAPSAPPNPVTCGWFQESSHFRSALALEHSTRARPAAGLKSHKKPFDWLPPPGAERPSEVNAMQSHSSSHHLPERPSTQPQESGDRLPAPDPIA
jgi:hypothetical protein